MFNRDAAFSMNIRDPNNPEDNSPIIEMLSLDGSLLIFKSSGIYRSMTADTIDPEKKYPETCHSCEKLYSVGANNAFVARMILQFNQILDLAISDEQRKQQLVRHVWGANRLLLDCEDACYSIYQSVMELMPKCDQIIEAHKKHQAIPALPQVEGLERQVDHFLNRGKQFLMAAYQLLHIFYDMPFNDRNNAHFDKHREWIKHKFGDTNPIFLILERDEPWIRIVSEARNALQHPEDGQKVEVENFTLNPGNRFSAPSWKYDLTKKGCGKRTEYADIVSDFDIYLKNMLIFFEDVLILCIQDELRNSNFLSLYRKREEKINPVCPIMYEVNRRE